MDKKIESLNTAIHFQVEPINDDYRRPGDPEDGFIVFHNPNPSFGWMGRKAFENFPEVEKFVHALPVPEATPACTSGPWEADYKTDNQGWHEITAMNINGNTERVALVKKYMDAKMVRKAPEMLSQLIDVQSTINVMVLALAKQNEYGENDPALSLAHELNREITVLLSQAGAELKG